MPFHLLLGRPSGNFKVRGHHEGAPSGDQLLKGPCRDDAPLKRRASGDKVCGVERDTDDGLEHTKKEPALQNRQDLLDSFVIEFQVLSYSLFQERRSGKELKSSSA